MNLNIIIFIYLTPQRTMSLWKFRVQQTFILKIILKNNINYILNPLSPVISIIQHLTKISSKGQITFRNTAISSCQAM
jgi:hypothetical protein